MARPADLPALETRYRLDRHRHMLRMVVRPERLAVPPPPPGLVHLGPEDHPALSDLYALWPRMSFHPGTLEPDFLFGIYDADRLVAVAGAHAHSRRYGAGIIGGVFTHPAYRSRGFATAVTGAVAGALAAAGAHDIALNVLADTVPAIAAYRRLGFTERLAFLDARAIIRA